jgi:hypothetical protein
MPNLPVTQILALSLTMAAAATSTSATAVQTTAPSARDVFLQRVDEYVVLHRRLEADLPPEIVTSDPERLLAPRITLARELRKARATARQGNIFIPAVADYFRGVITEALRVGEVANLLEIIEDENFVRVIPTVNGDYPAGASISLMPACLLAALPPLPKELEYRFLSRDLILWDVHAGLIVDFVPQALVETTMTRCP